MPKRKKTWQEKLEDDKGRPRVERIAGRLSQRWGKEPDLSGRE